MVGEHYFIVWLMDKLDRKMGISGCGFKSISDFLMFEWFYQVIFKEFEQNRLDNASKLLYKMGILSFTKRFFFRSKACGKGWCGVILILVDNVIG